MNSEMVWKTPCEMYFVWWTRVKKDYMFGLWNRFVIWFWTGLWIAKDAVGSLCRYSILLWAHWGLVGIYINVRISLWASHRQYRLRPYQGRELGCLVIGLYAWSWLYIWAQVWSLDGSLTCDLRLVDEMDYWHVIGDWSIKWTIDG